MGEFKKGDFVRRVKPSDEPKQFGDVDGIYQVIKEDMCGIVVIDGMPAASRSAFEPWQPRVGERVRVVGNDQWKGDGEVTELRNYGIFIVSMKTGQFAGKPGGFYVQDLEPSRGATATPEQPAALKIEAGKFNDAPDWFECMFCKHKPVCKESAWPRVTCRSCIHSSPEMGGDGHWSCARWAKPISFDEQKEGCPTHLTIPALVPGTQTDCDEAEETITYVLRDGTIYVDGATHA